MKRGREAHVQPLCQARMSLQWREEKEKGREGERREKEWRKKERQGD